jgi:hypothetical protein
MSTHERSVNPPTRHLEAALDGGAARANLVLMSASGRSSHEVSRLIERLRKLVAEGREANRREITRLQRRLATVVKRELTH